MSISLNWSAPYKVAKTTRPLPGDKILLPPSALEQLLLAATTTVTTTNSSQVRFDPFNVYSLSEGHNRPQRRDLQQLPHPLTFRLVNPRNGNSVYAGIREFSAEENEIGLSPFLRDVLGVKQNSDAELEPGEAIGGLNNPINLVDDNATGEGPDHIMVHAKQLPRGTYVRLRPLEAGYNPEDWKSLLERHLRENYTTLTNGEILAVPSSRNMKGIEFRFLVDKVVPEGDGICVVDTDLEVDIEALNEEQARETLNQIISKAQQVPGAVGGSSVGGVLDIWHPIQGQVLGGEYVDYELPSWDRSGTIEIEVTMAEDEEIDLLVSPFSTRQRTRPRADEHLFGDFTSEVSSKTVRLPASNVELEGAEALYISIHAYEHPEDSKQSSQDKLRHFSLRARAPDVVTNADEAEQNHSTDEQKCKNCLQWVPVRTMMLHENFCLRNNVVCTRCSKVFKKTSPEWASHWHCPHDNAHGNREETLLKHNYIFHRSIPCPNCPFEASSLPVLANHRTTVCPGKLILCKFCHLSVPQEGDPFDPSPETILSGLTAHELADGSRTTNCHLCQAIVRLRDMSTHLKHHDLSRQSKPLPRICHNANCGRTLDGAGKNGNIGTRMGQGPGNELDLCSICFGPLYVSTYDPDGRAMKRRIERRYISQLIQGCGKGWCANRYCKFGRVQIGLAKKEEVITTRDAFPMVKPLMEDVLSAGSPTYYFCVDEGSQMRRKVAELVAEEGVYDLPWCIAACEAEDCNLDRARSWLQDWAPRRAEGSH